jgi:hypothetical protein
MKTLIEQINELPQTEKARFFGYVRKSLRRRRIAQTEQSLETEYERRMKMYEKIDTGCEMCNLEQERTQSRVALCEQHHLEYLAEEARISVSDFHFALLSKIVELGSKIKGVKE